MNIIATSYYGNEGKELESITKKRHKKYADRCNAELIIMDVIPRSMFADVMMQKMKFIHSFLSYGKRVNWIDGDILIRSDSPDLFSLVPPGKFAAVNEGALCNDLQIYERCQHIVKTCQEEGIAVPEINRRYFNMGMFLASKEHAYLFEPRNRNSVHNWCEQSLINARIAGDKVAVVSLPECFNRFVYWWPKPDKYDESSYFLHYAGPPSASQRISDMQKQCNAWSE